VLFVTANLLSKIFYSLNAIDIPEFFEDHMAGFMTHFSKYLTFQTKAPALLEGFVCIRHGDFVFKITFSLGRHKTRSFT
jgi:hypothetical protein